MPCSSGIGVAKFLKISPDQALSVWLCSCSCSVHIYSLVPWIASLTSLDVYNSGAYIDIRKPISLHQAVRHPIHTACYTESTQKKHSFKWRYFILKVVSGSSSSIHTCTLRSRGVVSSIAETLNSCWARQGVPNTAWESHHRSKAAFRVATNLSICRIRRPLAFTCKSVSKQMTCTSSSLNLFQQDYWATTRCSCTTSSSVIQQYAKKWTFLIVAFFLASFEVIIDNGQSLSSQKSSKTNKSSFTWNSLLSPKQKEVRTLVIRNSQTNEYKRKRPFEN